MDVADPVGGLSESKLVAAPAEHPAAYPPAYPPNTAAWKDELHRALQLLEDPGAHADTLELVPLNGPAPAAMSMGVEQSRNTKDPPPAAALVPPTATITVAPAANMTVDVTMIPRAVAEDAPAATIV